MFLTNKILGLIPARGGSKGILGKNTRVLCGKPLIGWSIEHAHGSQYIDEICVTTDDADIARVAKTFGANVPFIRPPHLATDTATSVDVILHALDFYQQNNHTFDLIVLLEPTSPLRDPFDIDNAIEALCSNPTAESVVGVSKVKGQHPDFLMRSSANSLLQSLQPQEFVAKRRQDLEPLYFLEGSLYISRVDSLVRNLGFCHEKTMGYVLPEWKAYEIDEPSDLIVVSALLRAKLEGLLRDDNPGRHY